MELGAYYKVKNGVSQKKVEVALRNKRERINVKDHSLFFFGSSSSS